MEKEGARRERSKMSRRTYDGNLAHGNEIEKGKACMCVIEREYVCV